MNYEEIDGHGATSGILKRNHGVLKRVKLKLHNGFVGLVNYPTGQVHITNLILEALTGDNFNIRGNNVFIHRLKVRGGEVTLDYEEYHWDAVQAYSTKANGYTPDPDGAITNVYIAHVDIEVTGPESQIFMLSNQGGFINWHIGYRSLRIRTDYWYWFSANTLTNSVLGNNFNKVDIAFNDPKRKGKPLIRIGDGIANSKFNIKTSKHKTKNVIIKGCGLDNVVPPIVKQY